MSLIRTPIYSTKESPQYHALKEIVQKFTVLERLIYQVSLSYGKATNLLQSSQIQPEQADAYSNQVDLLTIKANEINQFIDDNDETDLTGEIKALMNNISTQLNLGKNPETINSEVRTIKDKLEQSKKEKEKEARDKESDDYKGKLIKYIPGEVVVTFTALVALATQVTPENLISASLLVAGVVGLLATPGYLWIRSRNLLVENQPEWFMYVLAPVAFVFWAVAVSEPTRNLLSIEPGLAQFLLALSAFIIPFLDEVFTAMKKRRKNVRA